ncbi:hypothetical protein GLW04_19280 [Halobacillus litoralis]|uniref:MerR family transcriptional regulator n=1 Tax=Halobacillus litoralis TaxID=45668 RepID=A0A845DWU9_9BACI|nr:hypothetical protein [Halobacillus litoralis]MYL22020.1 hypothetical protein [Halobacillus litoralis]
MNSSKLFKNVSIVVLVFLLAMNGYFFYANGQNEEKYAAIVDENERLVEENEILKENEKNISNTAREQTFEDLLNQANLFVDLVYVQKVDGYQERKDEAKNVMNEELQERYFPADEYNQNSMESRILSDKYYIENMDMNQQEVDVLMEIKHEINYVESGKKDESHMFIRVNFERQDERWIATNIEDLFADTEALQEEEDNSV